MAIAKTGQTSSSYCPYVSLEVTSSSSTGGSATYDWTLTYNTVSGYALSTSNTKRVVAKINGDTVYDAYVTVGGKTTFTIKTGTKTINKTTSSQTISVEVAIYWGSASWSGTTLGTKTGSTSFTLSAKTSYTITYDANGGSGAPSSQTKWYGTTLTLSSTKPTRSYYTFSKWNTSSDGSGTTYSSGGSYTANAKATLYAIWTGNTYTITYNANGGSNAPASTTKKYGSTGAITSAVPTRTNYNFKGWATSSGSTTVTYKPGATLSATSITANTTLYAVWELAHTAPTISGLSAFRCDSSGNALNTGSYASVSFSWVTYDSYTASSLTVTGSSSTSITVSGTSGSVSNKVIAVSANETTITVTLADSASTSATATFALAAAYTFIFGVTPDRSGVSIGKLPEKSSVFDIGLPIQTDKSIALNGGSTGTEKIYFSKPGLCLRTAGSATDGYGLAFASDDGFLFTINTGALRAYRDLNFTDEYGIKINGNSAFHKNSSAGSIDIGSANYITRFFGSSFQYKSYGVTARFILGVQSLTFSTSDAITDGSTESLTCTLTSVSGASGYIVLPIRCSYGTIYGLSRSNTTITVNVMNLSGGTHTISGAIQVIAYS